MTFQVNITKLIRQVRTSFTSALIALNAQDCNRVTCLCGTIILKVSFTVPSVFGILFQFALPS